MKNIFFNIRLLFKFWRILSKRKFILSEEVLTFEKRLAKYFGLRHALGVANGTDALILALKVYNIGPGDEVIVPAFGFFSTAGAVAWINARPVFVDISFPTLHIDVSLIERAITPHSKAIIVTHLNGVVIDIGGIVALAKKHNLPLIEDYAQAFGSRSPQLPIRYGDIVCLSFNPTKIIHAYGDGGALLMDDDAIAKKIEQMRMYGTNVKELGKRHHIFGVASRLSVWGAAALNLQLDSLDSIISKRKENYFFYLNYLDGAKGMTLPEFSKDPSYAINGYRFVVLMEKREELFLYLKKQNVDVEINHGSALPFMPVFSFLGHKPGTFPVAERAAREALTLSTCESSGYNNVDRTAGLVRKFNESRAFSKSRQ